MTGELAVSFGDLAWGHRPLPACPAGEAVRELYSPKPASPSPAVSATPAGSSGRETVKEFLGECRPTPAASCGR